MAESNSKKLPKFNFNQELVDFFDTHDMGEYEGELPEVNFDIDIKRKHYLVSKSNRSGYLRQFLVSFSTQPEL